METTQPQTMNVDIGLIQATLDYLQKQPYNEVYQLISGFLQNVPKKAPVLVPKSKPEAIVKEDNKEV